MAQNRSSSITLDYASLLRQSAIATTVAHPARVILNCVSARTPLTNVADFARRSLLSYPTNFARGTTVFSAQLGARMNFPGHENIATAVTGTGVASLFETPLIIQNNKNPSRPKPKFNRFGIMLTSHYFCREMGFALAVFDNENASRVSKSANFAAGVLITSAFHKCATLEATKGLHAPNITTPKLREGFSIITKLATGGYTHPALAVKFPHPSAYWQAGVNLCLVTFDPKVVAARTLYLATFKAAFFLAKPTTHPINTMEKSPDLLNTINSLPNIKK